jgi:CDP-diacylglycerol--serine O-phosphatidyltransferase
VPFFVVIALVLAFVFISSYPPGVLFALFLVYAFSGYAMTGWQWLQRRRKTPA